MDQKVPLAAVAASPCRAPAHRTPGAWAALSAVASLALASTCFALEKAVVDGPAAAEQTVEFNIYLPLRDRAATDAFLTELQTPGSAVYHQWLTPAQFNERFGPQASTVNAITHELAAYGLQVTEVKTHGLHVSGSSAAVEAAFGSRLSLGHFASGRQVLVAATPLRLTPSLQAAGAMITAFSGTIHMHKTSARIAGNPANRESPTGGYWFDDLKQAYSYPSYKQLTGKGVTIGILMTPGYNPPDVKNYFEHEKIPAPNITTFNVEGGAPYDPTNPFNSAETFLDIEQSGGMAPQANIILYNLPDLDDDSIFAGLIDIIENNNVDVVNMSFGEFEAAYSAAYPFNDGVDYMGILGLYDDFFMEGNALGITWVAASGDLGALQAPPPACFEASPPDPCGAMRLAVSTPASSPHVTAVGGTNLITTYNAKNPDDLNSAYVSENADDDPLVADIFYGTTATGAVWGSGGGISIYYAKPTYQDLVSQQYLPKSAKKWRTNPDVAMHMGGCPDGTLYVAINGVCPPDRSFDWVGIDGGFFGFVGTSASSPDFVGLLALKIESEGSRLGNENFDIYSLAAAQAAGSGNKVYRQDIPGNNGFYNIAPGYNLVLGNGTVIGNHFVRGPALPAAGVPQTPSNP
jgi:subtilase family serine protease